MDAMKDALNEFIELQWGHGREAMDGCLGRPGA